MLDSTIETRVLQLGLLAGAVGGGLPNFIRAIEITQLFPVVPSALLDYRVRIHLGKTSAGRGLGVPAGVLSGALGNVCWL